MTLDSKDYEEQERMVRLGRIRSVLYGQPAFALTVGYLLLSVFGITFEFWVFHQFGINILDYAQAGDFLLAAVRNPLVVLLALAPLLLLWILFRLGEWSYRLSSRWAAMNRRIDTPTGRRIIAPLFVVFYFIYFTKFYAEYQANQIRGQDRQVIEVELVSESESDPLEGVLLGSTAQYLFLFVPNENRTLILPIDNVSHLTTPLQ